MVTTATRGAVRRAGLVLAALAACGAMAQSDPRIGELARAQKPAMLETMRELVAFESGSREIEELDRIAAHVASKFRALGAQVELVEPTEATTTRFSDTPERIGKMVKATFTGSGKARILLLAHMDTVYPKGMLARPAVPHRGQSRLRAGHRRRQAGHRADPPRDGDAEGAGFPRLRNDHGAGQRRRGDLLARGPSSPGDARRVARRHAVVRGRRLSRGGAPAPRHERHRPRSPQRARPRLARRLGA
jgi:hypothetical protein